MPRYGNHEWVRPNFEFPQIFPHYPGQNCCFWEEKKATKNQNIPLKLGFFFTCVGPTGTEFLLDQLQHSVIFLLRGKKMEKKRKKGKKMRQGDDLQV